MEFVPSMPREQRIADLRERIAHLEHSGGSNGRTVLPFGIPAIDQHLPGGGLTRQALHDITPGTPDFPGDAAATLFAAGLLARLDGPVLWCLKRRDLFPPGLSAAGLDPGRVIYAEAGDDRAVLLLMEEGLRHRGLGGVIGETARLPMTASRRLQLAAGKTGVMALTLRRWAKDDGPNAASTRWRITALPSRPLPVAGIGRSRWRAELVRCRGGEPAFWDVEGCDAEGRLALPADLADRSAPSAGSPPRAAAG